MIDDPQAIQSLQGFAYGFAQNLLASVVIEGKKQKEDRRASETAALLEQHEHSKPLESRIGQKICQAVRNLSWTRQELDFLVPLASDAVLVANLARQILSDSYSPQTIADLISQSSASQHAICNVTQLASVLILAIQSAIAEDAHLHRIKELQFQARTSEKIVEVETAISTTQDAIRRTGDFVVESVRQELHALLGQKALPDKASDEPALAEKIYDARVDEARKLLESGKPETARKMFEQLREEVSTRNPSKGLLFRIATNIGSCAIQTDDKATAIQELERAFELQPENPKAIANQSLAALLKGQPEIALKLAEQARGLLPKDSIATGNYIRALFAVGRDAELANLMEGEPWIEKDLNSCFAIGSLLLDRGSFADAENYFRLAQLQDADQPEVLVHLAHSIIRPVQDDLMEHPILNWKFPAQATLKLQEAEQLLTRAIQIAQVFETRRLVAFAHLLRADVRRMLGNEAAAISDCEIAFHHDPSNESALAIKALAHLHVNQLDQAIKTFERISNPTAKEQIVVALAIAYNATEKPNEALGVLRPYWTPSPVKVDAIRVGAQMLRSYARLQDSASASELIATMEATWPKHPEVLFAIAGYRRQLGQFDDAVSLLSEALAYSVGNARDFIALELADISYDRGDLARAAELYESAADLTTNNELSRRYLICLYKTGARKDALELAKALRASGEPQPVVSQVEANILAEIGDVKGAQQLMQRLSELHPKIWGYKIACIKFALRRGQVKMVRTALLEIKFDDIQRDVDTLLQVARLRAIVGLDKVLDYIYQARRMGFASAEVHATYAAMFVSREQIDVGSLTKDVSDVDCSVILKIGSQQHAYTIIQSEDLHPERGEISPEQARSMQLLGRKRGDYFVFRRDAFGGDVQCTVVDVQSKYVRAFQETIERFPSLFPTDSSLQPVTGTHEEIRDNLFHHLDTEEREFRKAGAFYESHRVPFEFLSRAVHRSPFELWNILMGGNYFPLITFSGTAEDAKAEAAVAAGADRILLDLFAIVTFAQLGLLEKLAARYKLCTTQPVLDAMTEQQAKAAIDKPHMSIGKVGEAYVRHEITAEQVLAHKDFLTSIVGFLSEHVDVVPTPSLLDETSVSHEFRSLLGPISTASIIAADTEALPLYSEDQMLRWLARNERKVRGMSVQPILQELTAKKLITREEHTEALAKLVLLNYRYISITPASVLWVIERAEYQLSLSVTRMLEAFSGTKCTFESAVEVLAEVVKVVWLETILYHKKVDLLDAILEVVGMNRPTNQAADYFLAAITHKLLLVPNAADAISERVRQWRERKLGRIGIVVPSRYRAE